MELLCLSCTRPRMVYHSSMNEVDAQQVCGCSMLPIVTTTRGPAPLAAEGTDDIIDEVLGFFKANVLSRTEQSSA